MTFWVFQRSAANCFLEKQTLGAAWTPEWSMWEFKSSLHSAFPCVLFCIPSDPQRTARLYYDTVLCIMHWTAAGCDHSAPSAVAGLYHCSYPDNLLRLIETGCSCDDDYSHRATELWSLWLWLHFGMIMTVTH